MQGVDGYAPTFSGEAFRLELRTTTTATTSPPLSIDVDESAETRIQRLISENPVVIFSRSSCCMCHVMKNLLWTIGVHPTVIELEEDDIAVLGSSNRRHGEEEEGGGAWPGAPALYIGGACVGGFESVVALHLSNGLVPKLAQVGAL